jgi:hypothetical protein
MRNELKALAATVLVGAGGAALAGVAYLQANRLALTTPKLLSVNSDDVSFEAGQPYEATFLPVTGPIRQVAAQPPAVTSKHARSDEKAVEPPVQTGPKSLVPCSDWLDMGPAHIKLANGPERRRVQMLCPEGATFTDYYRRSG